MRKDIRISLHISVTNGEKGDGYWFRVGASLLVFGQTKALDFEA